MAKAITLRCAKGHTQRITFSPEMQDDQAHDFGVLLAGGKLRSIGVEMPGYTCQWHDGEAAGKVFHGPDRCGALVAFDLE